jgi:MFS transporter, AAHS family, 4-hydroxybenzoate transporter
VRDSSNTAGTEHSGTLDLGKALDHARFRGLPLRVFVFAALALIADGFDIQAIAFVAPALLTEWNVTRAALAPVLAAGLVGMGIGSFAFGTLGDRWGRRSALLAALVLVAMMSLMCALARDLFELGMARLLLGLGLGGALPNASALMAEYAPARHRSVIVAAAVVGIPLGGLLGAEVSAQLIPTLGWRSLFVVGAVAPALLVLAMWFWLPESARFLARDPSRRSELLAVLARLGHSNIADDTELVAHEPKVSATSGGLRTLWSNALRRDTAGLWLAFFASVFVVYSIFSWLPTVLTAQGLPLTTAIRGSLVFNVGGVVGSLLAAWLMTRLGSRRVLVGVALAGIATLAMLGLAPASPSHSLLPLLLGLTVAGACINGVQVGLYPLASHIYPTACRATGVGWALGVARFGGVLSAFAGSAVLVLGAGTLPFFGSIAVAMTLVVAGLMIVRRHVTPAER